MQRMTISVDDDLAQQFDALVHERGYQNRSEAFRDLVRRELEEQRIRTHHAPHCIANLSYVYDHNERQLARRLATKSHGHHDLSHSTMHVHLDHDDCIESVILRGPTKNVQQFAESVITERGVRHGQLNLIPVDAGHPGKHTHKHLHLHPTT